MQELAGVGHPEGERGGLVGGRALLDDGQDHGGQAVQHLRQSDGSLLRHQLGLVVGGGAEPRGHVDGVGGRQLEVDRARVEAKG